MPAFQIVSIEPTSGPITGGTVLKLFGENFVNTTALYCRFGDKTVLATFESASELVCISPSVNVPGHVALRISFDVETEFLVTPHSFKYYAPEIVYSILPSSVSTELNKALYVVVSGENFINTPKLQCKLESHQSVDALWLSESKVRCALESNNKIQPGKFKILVSNNGQNYPDQIVYFTKRKSMRVLSIEPKYGSRLGGTKVNIVAMSIGEMGSVYCQFGMNAVVGTVIAMNEIYCISPMAEKNEAVGISVAFGKSNFLPLNATFEYGEVFDFENISPHTI